MGLERDLERDWGLEVGSCIEPYGLFNYLNPEMEKLLPSQKKKIGDGKFLLIICLCLEENIWR